MTGRGFIVYLLLALLLLPVSVASAETVIRVTLQLPESHSLGRNWNAFKEIIERDSDGALTLELFPSAQLFRDQQVPEAVGSGAIEAGSSFLGRFAGFVPAVDVISLPFFFDDEAAVRSAIATGAPIRDILDAEILKETGARVLWWQAFGRNVYLSKRDVVRLPADIRGKKVRTYGKVQGWTIEALGGAPTLMSGSRQFIAYQQGAVDIGMTGVSAVESRKLYEVMKHMTLTYDSVIEFVAVMNNDFFESLPPDQQAIILAAAATVEQQLRDHIYGEEASDVESLRDKIDIVELTDAERDAWRTATSAVVDRFVSEGGPAAKAVVDAGLAAQGR